MRRRRKTTIELKSPEQIRLMRLAGLAVADGLAQMSKAAVPGSTTGELDQIGRDVLARHGATSNFQTHHGGLYFPGVICASVNDEVVHGIPNVDRTLTDGDLISIDYGAIVQGWNADAAVTVAVGEFSAADAALSAACEKSMWDGIAAAQPGSRLSDVSHAVETSIRTSGKFGIVRDFGGHGIGSQMHMDPHILNYGEPGRGPELLAGMALAIEPMLTQGAPDTAQLSDEWTIVTQDGSRAAHWEHTVALLADGLWVLTAPDGGNAALSSRGVRLSALAAV
jgi:methionyl aminopeptidase